MVISKQTDAFESRRDFPFGDFFCLGFCLIVFSWTSGDFYFLIPHSCSDFCCLLFHYPEFIFADQSFPCCSILPHCIPVLTTEHKSSKILWDQGSALISLKSYEAGGNQETQFSNFKLLHASDCFNRGI